MHREDDLARHVLVPAFVLAALAAGATSYVVAPASPGRSTSSHSASQLSRFPGIVLWAWERAEDLRFIDPRQVGVAFLAETLYLRGDEVIVRPRLQPLQVPPGTALMATARIETNQAARKPGPPVLSPAQRTQAASAITCLGRIASVQAVQIDFDASASERAFYRELVQEVRRGLPDSTALSITALASWCEGDNWLGDLPIDEAVPMLFRMGPDRREILGHFRGSGSFAAGICNQSVGVSTDEPLGARASGRRVYIFRPGKWSEQAVRAALAGVKQ